MTDIEKLINESIESLLERNSFAFIDNEWSRETIMYTPGQTMIVNGVRREHPGVPINVKQCLRFVGEAILSDEFDNEECRYAQIEFELYQNGETMGELNQLFSESDTDELIEMCKKIFNIC